MERLKTRTSQILCSGRVAVLMVFLVASLSVPALGTPESSLFAEGNVAFHEKGYDEAARSYRSVLEREGTSASLYHNLALVYREQDLLGQAVLSYERALWMTPRDHDIRKGLQSLREEANLVEGLAQDWTKPLQRFSLSEWTTWAAGAWLFLGLLCLVSGLGLKRLPIRMLAIAGIAVLVVAGVGCTFWIGEMNRTVVMDDQAPLLVSPYAAASRTASVREGTVLVVKEVHGGFVKVSSENGPSGWMASEHLCRIVPADGDVAIPERAET